MSKNKTVRNVFFAIFCLFACISLGRAESCSVAGQVQYKTSGSCGTSERTCCATTGEWSDWGGSCPSCSSSQCWDGSKCEDAPSDKGKTVTEDCAVFGISYTCNSGTGWEKSKTYIHPASSATSCWDGSSCVAKPSTCDQKDASGNCRIYTTTCTCTPSTGWSTSRTLTSCNASDLVPRNGVCSHAGGAYIWVPGESNPAVNDANGVCPFSVSSIKTCGSTKYVIYSGLSYNSCMIKNYPVSGYNTRFGRTSSL